MKDIYLKKLETSCDYDVQSFLAIAKDPEIDKFVNYMCIEQKDFAKSFLSTAYVLGVFDDSSHKLVGAMHIMDSDPDSVYSNLEVAYFIGKNFRNLGYGKSSINALKKKFANSKFICLTFYVSLENIASLTVLRSITEVVERRYDDCTHVFIIKL